MISILIGTCDDYSHLWKNFSYLFDKYWDKELNYEKFFMSETIDDESLKGFQFIKNGKVPYSNCLIHSLNQIKTPYVLWMQDDYFLRRTISKNEFDGYFNFVIENKVDRLGICLDTNLYSKSHFKDGYYRMDQNSKYTISMQSSIWNVDFFKSCLIENENPWEFEVGGSKRLNKRKHNIYLAIQKYPWYLEAMRKGKYTDNYYRILKEENIS